MKKYMLIALLMLISLKTAAFGIENGWVFTNFVGGSSSFHSSLFINLDDEDNIKMGNAKWDGKSLQDSLYYAIRLDKWKQDKAWGIEWIHHKIYLENNPSEIENLSISDGFNIFYVNRTRPFGDSEKKQFLRFGAGLVFAHIDITLSGRERFWLDGGIGGSYLCGLSTQVSVDRWVYETERYFYNLETKFTASYARPPVSTNNDEYAVIPNYAIHFLVGIGNKPATPKGKTLKENLRIFAVPPLVMKGTGIAYDMLFN